MRDARSPAEGRRHFLRALETQIAQAAADFWGGMWACGKSRLGTQSPDYVPRALVRDGGGLDPPKAAGG